MLPDNGTAKRFEIKNTVEILLNLSIVTGNTIICAEIITEKIFVIFLFTYFPKAAATGLFKYIIPNAPRYDNINPISIIAKGLSNRIISKDIAIDVKISSFLYTIFENSIIIPIKHARTTDGLNLVININNISVIIVIIEIPFLGVLSFINIKLTPIIM